MVWSKRLKLSSTSRSSGGGDPAPGNGRITNEDPDRAQTPSAGSENGGTESPAPDAHRMELNPLLMQDIFDYLLKFLPPKELPITTARLVCSDWKDHTLSAWRSSTVKLYYPDRKDEPISLGNGIVKTTLEQFLNCWERECHGNQSESKVFHSFHLSKWEFSKVVASRTIRGSMTNRFWELIGDRMTSLKLSGCVFNGPNTLRKLLYRTCRNLKTITLEGCDYKYGNGPKFNKYRYIEPKDEELMLTLESLSVTLSRGDHLKNGMLPVSWLEILSHFPKLKSLSLSLDMKCWDYEYRGEHIRQVLTGIQVIRNRHPERLPINKFVIYMGMGSKRRSLTSLRQSNNYWQDIFRLVDELGLPLSSE